GLAALPDDCDVVAVHDGARPLSSARLWRDAIAAVTAGGGGAGPALPGTDTIKGLGKGRPRPLDRAAPGGVQTPPVVPARRLRRAHSGARHATDDAAVVEADGGTVVAVAGEPSNLKIPAPADLVLAAALLDEQVPS